MLLFRGADRECLNYAGQTAYQVRNVSRPAKYSSEPGLAGWAPHNTISKSIDILVYI